MKKLILAFTLLTFSTSLQSQTMHIVNAGNYYYQPSDLSISQGDSVKFINDNGYHDVLITSGPEVLSLPACSGPCDIGVLVFNTPGDYEYICSIGSHSSLGMVGTISVSENNQTVAFQPQTKEELQTAVDLWVDDNSAALINYGDINTWDVSLVNDMSNLFSGKDNFNDDISGWDVSNVVSMNLMFQSAISFNQDLSSWDVSDVTNMRSMFDEASSFNQDIDAWNTQSVYDMGYMFSGAQNFNQDLSSWDVSNVTDMGNMFANGNSIANASSFDQDLSNWNVSNVTNMESMFRGASNYNQSLNNWDVSNVTDMSGMFMNAESYNQDLSS